MTWLVKDWTFFTIGKFIVYASATMVTLALPIAILLSSIMTFGKLGESFELVAIKSSGIPLLSFMRPLLFVAILLMWYYLSFCQLFIPSQLEICNRLQCYLPKSPAFDLKGWQFFTMVSRLLQLRLAKKKQMVQHFVNVLIYEQSSDPQDNIVIAEKGVMKISDDENYP